jgi:hypothetical protein
MFYHSLDDIIISSTEVWRNALPQENHVKNLSSG